MLQANSILSRGAMAGTYPMTVQLAISWADVILVSSRAMYERQLKDGPRVCAGEVQ